MQRNDIESAIHKLNPGEAIHLGHSAVVGNFGGIRVGFDIASMNGYVLAPFANFTEASTTVIPHLIPLLDKQSFIPRPQVIAEDLDILVFSHLHPDHFSLPFITMLRAVNPNIRIICPTNSKKYLLSASPTGHTGLLARFILRFLGDYQRAAIDEYLTELKRNPAQRLETIQSLEELPLDTNLVVQNSKGKVCLSGFRVLHPSYQFYFRMPFEGFPAPFVTGYKLCYQEEEKEEVALFVGEAATDPRTLSKIFEERDHLSAVFYPIIEQIDPKGLKLVEELTAHSSPRALALIERIVKDGTKIIPLHQGLWYFRLSSSHIVSARLALQKLAHGSVLPSPFITLTKEFLAIRHENSQDWNFGANLLSLPKRWMKFKSLARAVKSLPISGVIDGLAPGKLIKYSSSHVEGGNLSPISRETINSALQAHLAEYQWLRQDVDDSFNWQKTLIQYTLLVIGTVVTIVNAFPSQELLLLIASFMLTLLGWAYIEQSNRMLFIGRYLSTSLIPRVNELLLELDNINSNSPIAEKLKVLDWEGFFRGGSVQTFFVGVAAMGKHAYAVLPGIGFVLAFYLLKLYSEAPWTSLEKAAFTVAVIFSSFPILTGILNARFAFRGK